MFLHHQLLAQAASGDPVRVGLIGAGKFGTMFLAQAPTTVGMQVKAIADLDIDRAIANCTAAGWTAEHTSDIHFTEDAREMIQRDDVDVVVEATGDPASGIDHALACVDAGKHVVMVNVEADVLAGPHLAALARRAGVVYSLAYGDQPALTVELVEWARSCGFHVVAAGKGTKYLPDYHASTPDTVWDHYGLSADEAAAAGMRSQMFNSFLDGTKSAIEMAAIANATGLTAPADGLSFPPCGTDELAQHLLPRSAGGVLEHNGQVEVVSSLHRDGSEVERDLRWGVYCVLEAPNEYSAACFRQYGMNTDASGRYSAMYKPFHLIGLELNVSILSAALAGRPTGAPAALHADVVAVAKRDLQPGDRLDGEGGYTVWGKLQPACASVQHNLLPIGLASDVTVLNAIPAGQSIGCGDVQIDRSSIAWQVRERALDCLADGA